MTGADQTVIAESLGILTRSEEMFQLLDRAKRFAQSDISILITGESGTGKEVLARALHRLSSRAAAPFGVVNVAALPESLVESSLFGAERGAFTGAVSQKTGLIESAAGGTFFFDEIGDFPLQLQAKLLRVIQERKVMKVGATQERSVDVRFIFATHRTLSELVAQHLFREDLFYRVSEIQLHLPPLRDRADDPVYLAEYFAQRVGVDVLGKALVLNDACRTFVAQYGWPGNVRELYSAIKRAVILCDGSCIDVGDLQIPASIKVESKTTSKADESTISSSSQNSFSSVVGLQEQSLTSQEWDAESLNRARIEAEVKVVLACLKEHGGNVSSVAKLLHISRPTVYSILRKAKEWVST
ncbi:MAG: sigma-54 interaction domain-containing protein [Casimicrobium sp.]